ncbi:MAG: hypothetical protein KGJ59_10475 [Bacteroidota bacterium]|nr:hypothetical protein [Bacteroidota bacterium]
MLRALKSPVVKKRVMPECPASITAMKERDAVQRHFNRASIDGFPLSGE